MESIPSPSSPPGDQEEEDTAMPSPASAILEPAELTEASKQARAQQEELIRQVELRRKMRHTVVSTDAAEVRKMLRRCGEPITLFGEREMERRDRLRKLLATMDDSAADVLIDQQQQELLQQQQHSVTQAPTAKVFYTEGSASLKQARRQVAQESLDHAKLRLRRAKRRREDPDEDEAAERDEVLAACRTVTNQSSEIGDERPIVACAFRPDGAQLATGAWSGLLKLWSLPHCERQLTIKAHQDRITGLAWHPEAGSGQEPGAANIVTGGADTTARLWSMDGQEVGVLTGHTDRLAKVAWHPGRRLIATASFDGTWRLWDAATRTCLTEQEGHSRSVYAVAFQGDGALAASGGLDAIGRLWDLRTGRSIMTLQGHVKGIMALDFSPNGYTLASGSEDHSVRLWDLRKRKCSYTLPCHTSLVSQVRFEPCDGHYLLTAGYDNVAKLWSASEHQLIRTLAGHEGKVMGADIGPAGDGLMATVSYDRTIKLWSPDL